MFLNDFLRLGTIGLDAHLGIGTGLDIVILRFTLPPRRSTLIDHLSTHRPPFQVTPLNVNPLADLGGSYGLPRWAIILTHRHRHPESGSLRSSIVCYPIASSLNPALHPNVQSTPRTVFPEVPGCISDVDYGV